MKIINFGDTTKLEEWIQYNNDSTSKQQADFRRIKEMVICYS